MKTVTVGPFPVFFTNRNAAMGLKGHSHTGSVSVTYRDSEKGAPGFPAFEGTNRAVADAIRDALKHVVMGTNEDVIDLVWDTVAALDYAELHPFAPFLFACSWELYSLTLTVVGVPDAIGHDGSSTVYERTDDGR